MRISASSARFLETLVAIGPRARALGLWRTAEQAATLLRTARGEVYEPVPRTPFTFDIRVGPIREQGTGALAQASVTLREGELMLDLRATQDCPVQVRNIRDKKGNAVTPQTPTWTSSDPAVVTVTQDATDPLKANVSAVGPAGPFLISFEADGDSRDDGVVPITFTLDGVVSVGVAVTGEIVAGTTVEQPSA